MGKSRIGNGLILAGVSSLMVMPVLEQGPVGGYIYGGFILVGFIVGFIFPNF